VTAPVLAVILQPGSGKCSRDRPQPTNKLATLAAIGLAVSLLAACAITDAASGASPSTLQTLAKWTPLMVSGFAFNIFISLSAIGLGTLLGTFVGIGQISPWWPVRGASWATTQFFRNAPWLVLLFYCMLLLPFHLRVGGVTIPLPDWMKAIFGLSLAAAANVAEIVRGAVQSIPAAQWESTEALGFNRRQSLWMIILPQCVKRMLPPWMNLYALVMVSTPLCSIVGVNEVMTLTADALAAEGRYELLIPMYLYLLLWFFAYCYPIARATVSLERRFQVR
jgi:polar amino acid transport system permease protein